MMVQGAWVDGLDHWGARIESRDDAFSVGAPRLSRPAMPSCLRWRTVGVKRTRRCRNKAESNAKRGNQTRRTTGPRPTSKPHMVPASLRTPTTYSSRGPLRQPLHRDQMRLRRAHEQARDRRDDLRGRFGSAPQLPNAISGPSARCCSASRGSSRWSVRDHKCDSWEGFVRRGRRESGGRIEVNPGRRCVRRAGGDRE